VHDGSTDAQQRGDFAEALPVVQDHPGGLGALVRTLAESDSALADRFCGHLEKFHESIKGYDKRRRLARSRPFCGPMTLLRFRTNADALAG
jgi:hypothetical protein